MIFNSFLIFCGLGLFLAFKFYEKSDAKFIIAESNHMFGLIVMVAVILGLIASINLYTSYFLKQKHLSKL